MLIVWRLRRNIIRTAVCWIVWHNVHSQQHTYMSSSYRSNRLSLWHWDPYAVHRGGCLELYYCNMVEWFWWDSGLILTTNWFPSVLDTAGLVSWPVNIIPEMTSACVELDFRPLQYYYYTRQCKIWCALYTVSQKKLCHPNHSCDFVNFWWIC